MTGCSLALSAYKRQICQYYLHMMINGQHYSFYLKVSSSSGILSKKCFLSTAVCYSSQLFLLCCFFFLFHFFFFQICHEWKYYAFAKTNKQTKPLTRKEIFVEYFWIQYSAGIKIGIMHASSDHRSQNTFCHFKICIRNNFVHCIIYIPYFVSFFISC